MSQYKRNNYEILKEQSIEFLGGKDCCVCHSNFLPICCYDFHHYKDVKEENISGMLQRKNTLDDELKEELLKCKVICSNCHRQVTSRIIVIRNDNT